MRTFAKHHSLPLYFVLAFTWFWASLALNRVRTFHFWAPLVGAFAPTLSAVTVTAADSGARRAWFRDQSGQHSEMNPGTIPGSIRARIPISIRAL